MRRDRSYWSRHVAAWRRSGLSKKAYSEKHRLSYWSVRYKAAQAPSLRRRHGDREVKRESGPGGPPLYHQASVPPPGAGARLRVGAPVAIGLSAAWHGGGPFFGIPGGRQGPDLYDGLADRAAHPALCPRRHRPAELHPAPADSGADLRSPRADAEGHAGGGGQARDDLHGE